METSIQCTISVTNPIEWIEIEGFRGFAEKVHLNLSKPNGKKGSGLTIIVGPNNTGKSTIIESLHILAGTQEVSFNEFMTNKKAEHKVEITIKHKSGLMKKLKTREDGGSETEWETTGTDINPSRIFVLPSRRGFGPLLKSQAKRKKEERLKYISNTPFSGNRREEMYRFQTRIFKWQDNKKRFNKELKKILDLLPEWKINNLTGEKYLEISEGEARYNSEGLGDGILNILMIADAFYDSVPKETIVIDEPELSLHPSLQKKLLKYFAEYAKDRKIVISTHSPYFIDFNYLVNGAMLVRTVKENNSIKLYQLSKKSIINIKNFKNDLFNPHVLGLNAKEVFFLEDKVILVEGQKDVLCYENILNQLGIPLKGEFFGWGVGGAEKMRIIAQILEELGFKKVLGILDSDKKKNAKDLEKKFKNYSFFNIPTEDVIDKKNKIGICDKHGILKSKYINNMKKIFENINNILET